MADNTVSLSKEEYQALLAKAQGTQDPGQLAKIIEAAVRAARAPNILEQKALEEEIAKEKRKRMMMVQLGKIEEESARRKRYGCTHRRIAQGQKHAGHPGVKGGPVPTEATTGGQFTGRGNEIATLVCTRCGTTWQWRPTPDERDYLEQSGFLSYEPPSEDRLLSETCLYCSKVFTKAEFAAHDSDGACKERYEREVAAQMVN